MNFEPTEIQSMLLDSASSYSRARRERVASMHSNDRHADDWRSLTDMGWLALQLSEDMGGMEGGAVESMILMEALGGCHAREPYISTALVGARALKHWGSVEQQDGMLANLIAGNLRVAWVDGIPARLSGQHCPAVEAVETEYGYRLTGRQSLVLDGDTADYFLVTARDDATGSECLFWVRAKDPGVQSKTIQRLDAGGASQVVLNDVRVARSEMLGSPGAANAIVGSLTDHVTAALCAEAVGIMQAMHDQTLAYLKMRRQFGKVIGAFQVLQHAQVDMLIALELSRSIVMAACMALDADAPNARLLVCHAKLTIGQQARKVRHFAVQLHGGIGMTAELEIGSYFKRLTVIEQTYGSPEQLLRGSHASSSNQESA